MFTMIMFRPCLPVACRYSIQLVSRNFYSINLPLRIVRTRNWLHWQPSHLSFEKHSNCFLTKVLFNTNSPDANKANDANASPPSDKKRLSSKRRRIISESDSSDVENGTQDVKRKSELVH